MLDDRVVGRLAHESLHLCDLVQLILEPCERCGRILWCRSAELCLQVESPVNGRDREHLLHGSEETGLRNRLLFVSIAVLVGYHGDDLLASGLNHGNCQEINDPFTRHALDDSAVSGHFARRLEVLLRDTLSLRLSVNHLGQSKVKFLQFFHQTVGSIFEALNIFILSGVIFAPLSDCELQTLQFADLRIVRQETLLLSLSL